MRGGGEQGQASVELVVLLPLLVGLVLAAWQLVLAGHASSLAGTAARAGARAVAVGADPAVAARAALPRGWARRLELRQSESGALTVRVLVPSVVGGVTPFRVSATVAADR
jgi:pilus assembly protein CpaE